MKAHESTYSEDEPSTSGRQREDDEIQEIKQEQGAGPFIRHQVSQAA
jgi:hypothetical protein